MREPEREASVTPVVDAPSLDQVFDLLSHRRRRYVLYHLRATANGVATIDEVAEHVLHLEEAPEGREPDARSVRTSLQHIHIPKLEAAGVLDYDARSETLRYWNQPTLDEWLEHARHKEL